MKMRHNHQCSDINDRTYKKSKLWLVSAIALSAGTLGITTSIQADTQQVTTLATSINFIPASTAAIHISAAEATQVASAAATSESALTTDDTNATSNATTQDSSTPAASESAQSSSTTTTINEVSQDSSIASVSAANNHTSYEVTHY